MPEDPNAPQPTGEDLQFDRVDYSEGQEAVPQCKACNQPIATMYYEVNGSLTCESCREKILVALTGGSRIRRFVRATIFGAIAAGIGSGIYYAISYLTGYEFALVAIVVGLMVGGAVRAGANARGGWFYQCLAMFLTYTAIVSTYLPTIFAEIRDWAHKQEQTTSAPATQSAEIEQPESPATTASEDDAPPTSSARKTDDSEPLSKGGMILALLVFLVFMLLLAYAIPILAVFGGSGIIGLIIIGVALYEAWRMNKRPQIRITGPYELVQEGSPPESSQQGV